MYKVTHFVNFFCSQVTQGQFHALLLLTRMPRIMLAGPRPFVCDTGAQAVSSKVQCNLHPTLTFGFGAYRSSKYTLA